MTVDLDKLEQLARAATPGPWFVWFAEIGKWTIQVAAGWLFESSARGTKADAAFIAAANPAAVLELVQRLRAAEAGAGAALKDTMEAFNTGAFESACQYAIDQLGPVMDAAEGGPAVVVMREERAVQLEAIVRDLAASEPVDGMNQCTLCSKEAVFQTDPMAMAIPHTELCPWRRAVEAKP